VRRYGLGHRRAHALATCFIPKLETPPISHWRRQATQEPPPPKQNGRKVGGRGGRIGAGEIDGSDVNYFFFTSQLPRCTRHWHKRMSGGRRGSRLQYTTLSTAPCVRAKSTNGQQGFQATGGQLR
jgi:hypothetical protein